MCESGRTTCLTISSLFCYFQTVWKNLQISVQALFNSKSTCRQHVDMLSSGPLDCEAGEPRLTVECLAMSCRGEPGGSEFHLGEGHGRVFTFPVYPDYSLHGMGQRWGDGKIGSEHCAGAAGPAPKVNCT